jgi:hypothetical protein
MYLLSQKLTKSSWVKQCSVYLGLSLVILFQTTTLHAQFSIDFGLTHPTCAGNMDGSINSIISGGTSPFSYAWSNGETTANIQNQFAGTYTLTVTDANGDVVSESATLIDPPVVMAELISNTCTDPYTITALPDGGISPYTYLWSNGASDQVLIVPGAGDYCVTITDANLCAAIECITFNPDETLEVDVVVSNLTCPGYDDGTITAIPTGGAAPYSFLWSNGSSNPTISNLSPGSYTVVVTDASGCTAEATGVVQAPDPIQIQLNPSNPICFGDENGSIGSTVTGGTPPYTYAWNTGQSTPVLLNIGAGNYMLTVTDANGCIAQAQTSLIAQSNLVVGIFNSDEICTDANDGSATVVPSGGQGPYSYFWSNGAITPTINNLSPGTYNVTVSDALGCTAVAGTTIEVAPDFIISIESEEVSTCDAVDGSISVNVEEGTPPFSYAWNNGGNTAVINGLASGTYIVTVTNGDGCEIVETVILEEPPALMADINAPLYVCEGENNGVAVVNVSGGTPPFVYEWSDGHDEAINENLPAGAHSVTVSDANFCFDILFFGINEAPGIDISINAETLICGFGELGSATVITSGGTPPYTIEWSTGDQAAAIDNLDSGSYSVTVSDANGCRATESIDITVVNDFELSLSPEDIDCYGAASGHILALPTGGDAPYTFEWSTGASGSEINDLSPGLYSVTATDANGCTVEQSAYINEPSALFSSISEFDANCFDGDDGMAFTLVGGGTPPYIYEWSNGETESNIDGLSAGIYTLTVTDANACTLTNIVTIGQPNTLQLDIEKTDARCANSSDGTATAIVSGGTPPYNYAWSNGMTSASISALAAGNYALTVTDDAGCEAFIEFEIAAPPALAIGFSINDNICDDDDNGAISVTVEGGTPPYSYLWNNGETTSSITDLSSGIYTLTVTDDHNCKKTFTATITHVPGLELIPGSESISCFGANDGRASVEVIGGTAPFSYTWSNGATDAEITNLAPGNYTVTVTGSMGCSSQANYSIEEPAELIAQVNFVNATCFGEANGSASAQFTNGGLPPYSYAWSNGAVGLSVNNLAAGSYMLTVTDANDCANTVPFTIAEPSELEVMVTAISASCEGGNTGSAAVTTNGGNGFFTYAWDNGEFGQIAHELSAGIHYVTVTDPLGCEAIGSIEIEELNMLSCAIMILNPNDNGDNGSARVDAIGGQEPYTYLWSDGQTTQTAVGLGGGTYAVTVTDDLGCTTSCEVSFFECVEIGDYVWLDLNRDGLQDANEPPLENVMIILSQVDGNQITNIDTTYTDEAGLYNFCVNMGDYKITFISPFPNQVVTEQDAGSDDAIDSDVDPETGMSHIFTITNSDDLTIDAGFYNKCDNVTDAGEIGTDQYLCGPGVAPESFENLITPTGGMGELEYLWMYSTEPGPFDPEIWLPVPGSTGESFAPGPIYETTYFTRCVRRECCSFYQESNIITITVGNEAVAEIIGPNPICEGEAETFSAGPTGPDATFFWDFGADATPQTSTDASVAVSYPSYGPQEIFLSVTENGCTSTAIMPITVTNNPIECGNGLVIDAETDEQDRVRLSWEVAGTEEALIFTVERSVDGVLFEAIGEVNSTIDSLGELIEYTFLDENPKTGFNYYQVNVEDDAGNQAYSNVDEAIILADSKLIFGYPNPANDNFVLEFFETFGEDVRMDIISSNGIILNTIDLPKDKQREVLNFSDYPPGVYFIRIQYGKNYLQQLKLTKH